MRLAAAAIIAAGLSVAQPAVAASRPTIRQAEHAVRHELNQDFAPMSTPKVICRRLTTKRFSCRWGLYEADSNIGRMSYGGTAKATRLRYGWSVSERTTCVGKATCIPCRS